MNYNLVTELSRTVVHSGTRAECEMVLSAFETYGIRGDKFLIIADDGTEQDAPFSYEGEDV